MGPTVIPPQTPFKLNYLQPRHIEHHPQDDISFIPSLVHGKDKISGLLFRVIQSTTNFVLFVLLVPFCFCLLFLLVF